MRKTKLTLLFFFIVLLLTVIDSARAQYRVNESYDFPLLPSIRGAQTALYTTIKENFTLTLRDNVVLDCSRYYPGTADTSFHNGYPAVIMCHGFGERKETLDTLALKQSAYGYVVYTYSMRGQGNSGGQSNLISSTEAMDLVEYVNFIRTDFRTRLDTSSILIMGGSQGGIIPYMAACMGNLHVKCIISALASPEFASSWIENGSVKMTYLWSLSYPTDTVRYTPQAAAMQNWVLSSSPDKWDSIATWLPQTRNFTSLVGSNRIPVLLENAWEDKFFNTLGNINSIPLLSVPKRYYFGAVKGHGGDTSATENLWHMNFFNEWFSYWLLNINNGILTRPKFHFAYTSYPLINNMWSFVHDSSAVWPLNNISNLVLYFNPGSGLKTTASTTNTSVAFNNVVTGGLTMQDAVDGEFNSPLFLTNFHKTSLIFDTDTLTQDMKMAGTPVVNIDYSSNSNVCQFNFQIFDVKGAGSKLVTRVNYTDRYNTPNIRKSVSVNGISHSHIFQRGDKIRIVVTNFDRTSDDSLFLATNPHVLPVLNNSLNTLYLSNNFFIYLPMLNLSAGISSVNNSVPGNYYLGQNYPNPFNPSTTIKYSIPRSGFVTLKVYDIRGRETAVLVNNIVREGQYSVVFDASELSSGIYFYKLISDAYSETKKMILLK
jgi:predicted acyl esterase